MMKFSLVLIFILVLVIIFGYFVLPKVKKDNLVKMPLIGQEKQLIASPSPSPIPFADLTVPYLRERVYESKLGEMESYESNNSYKSFLTSYTSDGLKINGLLTEPQGEEPLGGWPAIVFVHGYIPPTVYKTNGNYVSYVDYLARNGFVVFKIDLRGHDNSEGEASGAYYSGDYIIDVLNAYSALQNSGFVNPSKIGIWGHSMAGNVTLRSVAVKRDIPAVSIWGGAVYTYKDMASLGIQDNSYRPPVDQAQRQRKREQLRALYGDPKDGNPFWELVAPTNYLEGVKTAIQLNHAVNDDVVNIEYSRGLNKILDGTSITHELNEFPSGGHNIADPSFTPAMQKTIDFFKKYL